MATANGFPPGQGGVGDRDLDLPRSRSGPRRQRLYGTYQGYQRLVANPFLALLAVVAWYACVRQTVRMKSLMLFWPVAASILLVGYLLQYHCLDCGATGRLTRWRGHACVAVRERYEAGLSRQVWCPNPYTQLSIWCYTLAVLAIFYYGLKA